MFVACMVVLTSGMFRLAELQFMRSLLQLSRVSVGDNVYVQPYEVRSVQYMTFLGNRIHFDVRAPAADLMGAFPEPYSQMAKNEDLASLKFEYNLYYNNWITRMIGIGRGTE